jgi:hypothetical protein
MISILLKDILNGRTYPEGGSVLFEVAKKAVQEGNTISLDLDGVESFPTTFMNTSFGDLIELYGIETTKTLFRFNNITASQVKRIRKYFTDYQNLIENRNKIHS